MVFRTWLVSFFKLIYFSSSFHLLTLIQSYLSPSTLFFTDTQCQGLEWDGCVWPAVTVPLPDWDYNTLQILTLLSTLKAAFWRCTLERVKEIWKEGPALCLEGLHLSPCPQGSFCVCACLGICMHVICSLEVQTHGWLAHHFCPGTGNCISWCGTGLGLAHFNDQQKSFVWCFLFFLDLCSINHLKFSLWKMQLGHSA